MSEEVVEKQLAKRIETPEQAAAAGIELHNIDGVLYVLLAGATAIITHNNGRLCNSPYLTKLEHADQLHPLHYPRLNWYPFYEVCGITSYGIGRHPGTANNPESNLHISEAQKARHARPEIKDVVRAAGKRSWQTRLALQNSGQSSRSRRAESMRRLRERRKVACTRVPPGSGL